MNPIEDGWRKIESVTPFCCDAHRYELKAIYFTGAMAALAALTGWDPHTPSKPLSVDADKLAAVSKELTAEFHFDRSEDNASSCTPVRH